MCKKGPLRDARIIFETGTGRCKRDKRMTATGTRGPKSEILQKGTIKGGEMVPDDDIE